jgi:hypothetical protein
VSFGTRSCRLARGQERSPAPATPHFCLRANAIVGWFKPKRSQSSESGSRARSCLLRFSKHFGKKRRPQDGIRRRRNWRNPTTSPAREARPICRWPGENLKRNVSCASGASNRAGDSFVAQAIARTCRGDEPKRSPGPAGLHGGFPSIAIVPTERERTLASGRTRKPAATDCREHPNESFRVNPLAQRNRSSRTGVRRRTKKGARGRSNKRRVEASWIEPAPDQRVRQASDCTRSGKAGALLRCLVLGWRGIPAWVARQHRAWQRVRRSRLRCRRASRPHL